MGKTVFLAGQKINKKYDLTGQRFGRLTVLYPSNKRGKNNYIRWVCSCSCGQETEVRSSHLRDGSIISCGCAREDILDNRALDISGRVFGRLTAIRKTDIRINGCVLWETVCSCGATYYAKASSLNTGRCLSCGCLSREIAADLGRARFGPLHPSWNPDITDEERAAKRAYPEYYKWRQAVYERDAFMCKKCKEIGGNLNAHHIESYDVNKDLRTTLGNGVTLCKDCHDNFHHIYGRGNNTREQFNEWMGEEVNE